MVRALASLFLVPMQTTATASCGDHTLSWSLTQWVDFGGAQPVLKRELAVVPGPHASTAWQRAPEEATPVLCEGVGPFYERLYYRSKANYRNIQTASLGI